MSPLYLPSYCARGAETVAINLFLGEVAAAAVANLIGRSTTLFADQTVDGVFHGWLRDVEMLSDLALRPLSAVQRQDDFVALSGRQTRQGMTCFAFDVLSSHLHTITPQIANLVNSV